MQIYSLVKIPEKMPEDLIKITEGKICGAIDLELEMLPEKEYGYKEAKSADTFDKLTGTLVIPEGYTHMSENCLGAYRTIMKQLVIPASMRKIHERALADCKQLREIKIPEGNNHYHIIFGTLCSLDDNILLWPTKRTLSESECRYLKIFKEEQCESPDLVVATKRIKELEHKISYLEGRIKELSEEKANPESEKTEQKTRAIHAYDKWSLTKKKVLKTEEELCERAKKYYLGLEGYRKDVSQALKLFREAANNYHYVQACNFIGEIHLKRREYERAYKWYLKSANAGDAEGNCMIGYFYDIGLEVERDEAKARSYYMNATDPKNIDTLLALAIRFQSGNGISKAVVVAANIFEVAAEQGNMEAQYQLGLCYLNGLGRNVDKRSAKNWLNKAIKQGCVEAKEAVKKCSLFK